MIAMTAPKWASSGPALATIASAGETKLERRISTDLDFFTDLVMASGVEAAFQNLADEIKADEFPVEDEKVVLAALNSSASKIWPGLSFSFRLTGSSRLGTAIKTSSGDPGDQSDFDYRLDVERRITPEEWRSFAMELSRGYCFYEDPEGLLGNKAIRLRDRMHHRRFEVVPAEGHFTYDNVRLGKTPRLELDKEWNEFFSNSPGGERATRVLKRMFPDIVACDITNLVVRQGRRGSHHGDASGWNLFNDVLLQFLHFPDLPENAALQGLVRDVKAQGSGKGFGKSLVSARNLAKILISLKLPD